MNYKKCRLELSWLLIQAALFQNGTPELIPITDDLTKWRLFKKYM